MAAEENDEEGQEDVLALTRAAAVTAFPREDGGEVGETDVETDAEPAPAEMRGGRRGGRTVEEIMAEMPGQPAGEPAEDESAPVAETLWKEGPVWPMGSVEPAINAAARRTLAEQIQGAEDAWQTAEAIAAETAEANRMAAEAVAGAERAARAETAESPLTGTRRAHQVQAGLEGLYRQAVRAARPAAPALPPERAGRSARAREPGSAASLAVDELDRAVRRDSRRYDGGMSIF